VPPGFEIGRCGRFGLHAGSFLGFGLSHSCVANYVATYRQTAISCCCPFA
jgi:hypothetical protein